MFGNCHALLFESNEVESQTFRDLPIHSYKLVINQNYTKNDIEFELDLTGMELYT